MTMCVMNPKAQIMPRPAMRRLTPAELHSPEEKKKRDVFDVKVKMKYGNSFSLTDPDESADAEEEGDLTFDPEYWVRKDHLVKDARGSPITTNYIDDACINTEVLLPRGE